MYTVFIVVLFEIELDRFFFAAFSFELKRSVVDVDTIFV